MRHIGLIRHRVHNFQQLLKKTPHSTNAVCHIYLNANMNNKCWLTSQWSGWLLNILMWLTNSMYMDCTCFGVILEYLPRLWSDFTVYLLSLLFNDLFFVNITIYLLVCSNSWLWYLIKLDNETIKSWAMYYNHRASSMA